MGSKARVAKEILPIMLKNRHSNQYWVEPFVGGANMIDNVDGNRIGADINKYLIEALIAIRDDIDLLPKNNKEFTEDDYKKLKLSDDYKYKGYAGFAFSYSGKWLGGWCRDGLNKRDYVNEAYKNAIKQSPYLQNISFINCGYSELQIPDNSIIYCDPPYKDTTAYNTNSFDHDKFWQWVRKKTNENHTVFVSEYTAPEDFEVIWQKEIVSSLTKNTGSKTGVEKLFVLRKDEQL